MWTGPNFLITTLRYGHLCSRNVFQIYFWEKVWSRGQSHYKGGCGGAKWRWWGWSDDDTVVKVSVLFVKSKHLKSTSTILSVCRIYSQCVLLWIHIHAFARRIFGAKTWRRHSNRSGCRRHGSPDSFHSPSCTNARGNVHCFESCSGTGGGKNVRASK